jgi:hypothetical protein
MPSIRLSDLAAEIKHQFGTAEATRLIMPPRDKSKGVQAEYAQALSQVLRQRYAAIVGGKIPDQLSNLLQRLKVRSEPGATDGRTPKPSEEEH